MNHKNFFFGAKLQLFFDIRKQFEFFMEEKFAYVKYFL